MMPGYRTDRTGRTENEIGKVVVDTVIAGINRI